MPPNPKVGVKFEAEGLDGVRRGLKIVKDEAEPTGRQWGTATRQISYGLESVARQGKVTGESMKQIISAGAEMAFQFGAGGPLVAGLTVVGLAIYEHITGRMKEAKEEAKKTAQEIGGLANTGDVGKIREKARLTLFGQPFDQDGKLVGNSTRVAGAFKGSLADMEAEYAELQAKLPKGAEYATGEIAKRWNELVPKLDKARDAFRQLQEAAGNVASQPAGNAGMLAAITAKAKAPNADPVKAWHEAMEELRKQQGYAGGQGSYEQYQREQNAEKYGLRHPDNFRYVDGKRFLPGLESPKIPKEPMDSVTDAMKDQAKSLGKSFSETLAESIVTGMEKAFAKGSNIGTVMAAIADTALAGLGSIAVQIGKAALTQFAFIKVISEAIAGLSPALGIPAAIALIAFGSALGGAGHRISANASGGGGGGGGYSSSAGYGGSTIDRGVIDPTRGSGVTPRNFVVMNNTIIGVNDPQAQSAFQQLMKRANDRGQGIG